MERLVVRAPLETDVIAIHGDGNIVPVPLRDGLTLGRGGDCGIQVNESSVALLHLRFEVTAGEVIVHAVGRRGFDVEGHELNVSQHILRVGDALAIGELPILFQHRLAAPSWYPEAQPLLDRIREAPDDDDARLVFADWLASRDPARAEFISCQIAASDAAVARANHLACVDFAAPLATPVADWTFRRGFVATARVLAPSRGELLLRDHPGCTVTTRDYPPRPYLRQ